MPDVPFFTPPSAAMSPELQTQQRQQQMQQYLAMALANKANQPDESMQGWNQMKLVPRMNPLQPLSKAFEAALTGKALQKAVGGASNLQQAMWQAGGNALQDVDRGTAPNQTPPAPTQTGGNALPTDPATGQQGPWAPTAANTPAPEPNRKLTLSEMADKLSLAVNVGRVRPEIAAAILKAKEPTELEKYLDAANADPAERTKAFKAAAFKAGYVPPTLLKEGELATPPQGGPPTYNPKVPLNAQPTYGPNGGMPTGIAQIPGGAAAATATAKATTAGETSQKPIKLGTDANGKDVFGFPTPPALGGQNGPNYFGGQNTASPAELQGQKTGAELGAQYSKSLATNATNATEVRRSLAELRNLASQADPSVANPAKMEMGNWMLAAGMDPKTASKILGVDPQVLGASFKQTGTLATNMIHGFTSRGTNFDLATFMRMNPSLSMGGPEAFNRVVSYMDNQAKQVVDKQKDFVGWSQGVPRDQWEAGHTAHWLDQQNADINAGKSNSPIPGVSQPKRPGQRPSLDTFRTP
jgi:hypothetical protein